MRRSAIYVIAGTVLLGLAGCSRNSGPDATNLAPADQYSNPPAAEQPPYEAPPPASETLAEAPTPPPPLPEYQQPPCPGDDYIWTPGYWGYENTGYYWVPGAWVMAPYVDALWTPPYWDTYGGRYRWHHGYWSRYVGFYGGINYGYGYTGLGFSGGYWNGPQFVYNRTVTNLDSRVVRNYYNHSVTNYTPVNRVSFNGPGGINRQATPAELAVRPQSRIAPLPAQVEHMRQAAASRTQFAGANRGRPEVAASPRPLATPYRAPSVPPAEWRREPSRGQEPRAAQPPQAPQAAPFRAEPPRMEGHGRPPNPQGAPPPVIARPSPMGPPVAAPRHENAPGRRFGEAGREAPQPPPQSHVEAPPRQAPPAQQPHVEAPHAAPPAQPRPEAHPGPPPQSHPGQPPQQQGGRGHGDERKK